MISLVEHFWRVNMTALNPEVDSYDRMKAYTAEMGMTLFGAQYNRPIPDRDRRLAMGQQVCSTISRGKSIAAEEPPLSFGDLELHHEFMSFAAGKKISQEQIVSMAGEADCVGGILEKMRRGEATSPVDIERSMRFFRNLYRSL